MSVTTELDQRIYAVQPAGGDYTGQATIEHGSNGRRWSSGTSTSQADKVYHDERDLGAGANEDLDLTTITDAYGTALGLAEVRAIKISADADNGDSIEVKPGAANGYVGALKDASDILQIWPGGAVTWECPTDGHNTVDGTHKVINVSNSDGAAGATYTITILGCSS